MTKSVNMDWSLDGVIPGKDGWIFIEWDLRTELEPSDDVYPWLERLGTALKTKGMTPIVIAIPPRGLLHSQYLDTTFPLVQGFSVGVAKQGYEKLVKDLSDAGFIVVNPLNRLLASSELVSFKTDLHWTPHGAREVAKSLDEVLKSLPIYTNLAKSVFALEQLENTSKTGRFAERVAELCALDQTLTPSEPVPQYNVSAGSTVGLLDEIVSPEVILLGTSFSDDFYGFSKFIAQNSEVDVLTISTDGGSNWSSLERFFMDDTNEYPKVLIWEFVPQKSEWDIKSLRQIVPMVYGDCVSESVLAQDNHSSETSRVLLENGSLPIQGTDYYVVIQFPDNAMRSFELVLNYQSSSEVLWIERSERVENNDRFFMALSDAEVLKNVSINLLSPVDGVITTRLCQVKS